MVLDKVELLGALGEVALTKLAPDLELDAASVIQDLGAPPPQHLLDGARRFSVGVV